MKLDMHYFKCRRFQCMCFYCRDGRFGVTALGPICFFGRPCNDKQTKREEMSHCQLQLRMRLKQTWMPTVLGAVRCQSLDQGVHQPRSFDLLEKPVAAARPCKRRSIRALKMCSVGRFISLSESQAWD